MFQTSDPLGQLTVTRLITKVQFSKYCPKGDVILSSYILYALENDDLNDRWCV